MIFNFNSFSWLLNFEFIQKKGQKATICRRRHWWTFPHDYFFTHSTLLEFLLFFFANSFARDFKDTHWAESIDRRHRSESLLRLKFQQPTGEIELVQGWYSLNERRRCHEPSRIVGWKNLVDTSKAQHHAGHEWRENRLSGNKRCSSEKH